MVPAGFVGRCSRVRLRVDFDPGGIPLNASYTAYSDGDVLGVYVYVPEPFDSLQDIADELMAWLDRHGIQMTLFE